MPIFTINTNLAQKLIKPDFLSKTAEVVAAVLNKPLSYVVVHINADQMMSWGGSTDPCAVAQLESIGQLGKAQNKKISAKLYEHIQNSLGIKPDRFVL
ncbi:hypothetical protein JTE90_016305 [Oedothorax gibbosus]|uniref:L-dopachrome isomerase n=1 Tax=Oedothorax gibbosus TaxID=931172 RepID=A0AAV6U7C5_9ARAC|nr:hypothetical protein JTE90_016305 [Oedothorax gibbosus]